MYLVEIFLPLSDNSGKPLERKLFSVVRNELAARFGGLTVYSRAPATGLWHEDNEGRTAEDDIVIYEVMARHLDRSWWADYRKILESRFQQNEVLIRVSTIEQI